MAKNDLGEFDETKMEGNEMKGYILKLLLYTVLILIFIIGLCMAEEKSGEEINWQVISSGGTINSASTSFKLKATVGQTATGKGSTANHSITHGFWQMLGCCDTPGDANNDGACNIGDEVFLGNFVFRSGQCDDPPGNPIGCPPECLAEGDANADGNVNIGDEVFLGNYIFRPPPVSPAPQCEPEKK